MAYFEYRNQPAKVLWLTYFLSTTLLFQLPAWIFLSAVPAFRPRRSWGFLRTFTVHFIKAFANEMPFKIGIQWAGGGSEKDSAHPEQTGFAWVNPVPESLVVGEINSVARHNDAAPARAPGYRYRAPNQRGKHDQPAQNGERTTHHPHGGAHISGSADPKGFQVPTIRAILETSSTVVQRAFAVEYRLASSAPFPAANPFLVALVDALSGYYYLVEDLGFKPENIIVAGDSSGGHLAVALTRYLVGAAISSLATPGALFLHSPAMD
ncbi:uncharacterized protein PHACADRAFT_32015 [Phanerochaete carnosa HHB-10118-sp]|uniref:Alpha/beta hydrolase fold-3 domain-containing protein n=1 Tax=Phanerochaete carnosa (strain HHB-10118-sp) TaxID=650164 RepID=K5WL09_PHACS|nr:uncharacterized protein PHACADRAFT_32015 [Phanerochaete carnosa HHB-10118-sp]EKM50952.1 hypothetical protein PHACADRAFT_32015 [Phanerochaete carnosa HHB-10118-sp]